MRLNPEVKKHLRLQYEDFELQNYDPTRLSGRRWQFRMLLRGGKYYEIYICS